MVYPCWVYGEGDTSFIPPFADAVYNKDLIFWRKNVIVWPTYIDNLIDILMLISEDKRAVGHGYIVHDGEPTTLQELCRVIANTLDVPPIDTHIPYFAAYAAGFVMEMIWRITGKTTRPLLTTYAVKNLGSRLKFSIEKAEKELGWKPKISYKEGLEHAMTWLKTMDIKKLKVK
jgi:nucleoside-diphosphate-sugar epimerase